jgi:molybdopterin-guanine dinucleotide biosynthesis protein A
MSARPRIVGVILCGGSARRMHGVEKPLELLEGRPLVAHVRDRLAPQVDRVLISANRAAEVYARLATAVVPDAEPGRGPLAGVSAALAVASAAGAAYLFVCPGDAPFLDPTLVARLAEALVRADAAVAIPHDGQRTQHLFLLMRVVDPACHGGLTIPAYLASGARSVQGWLATQRVVTVDAVDLADSFANINTPADLREARQHGSVPRVQPPRVT